MNEERPVEGSPSEKIPPEKAPADIVTDAPVTDDPEPWLRLHHRMIWVDIARTLLSLSPVAIAVLVFNVEFRLDNLWPVIGIAVFGVTGAVADFLRWVFTRYRVTDDYVERRTGIVVRRYRSIRRDRIRSVDIDARLRHRLAGLRVVAIGAGQQAATNEAALDLDAIIKEDAIALRRLLLRDPRVVPVDEPLAPEEDVTDHVVSSDIDDDEADKDVFATFRSWWVFYNMFTVWAYLMAMGVVWGAHWMGTIFGLDLIGFAVGLADWEALGWGWSIAIAAFAVGLVGAIGLGVNYFTENWGFELARVPGAKGTVLRTRRGLFRTREVNRDENRMRGIQISEPLLWRWMRMADTNVITTGLNLWSMSQPTTILPRGPMSVARPTAASVLAVDPNPMETELYGHPLAALRRRLVWATLTAAAVVGVLLWLTGNGALPEGSFWWGVWFWPVALLGGFISYRALGHAIVGDYLVVRSGLMARATSALQRSAVSTIVLRQSLLQQRLGLKTMTAATAAGWGEYSAIDLETDKALEFAVSAGPGLLDPFLVTERIGEDSRT